MCRKHKKIISIAAVAALAAATFGATASLAAGSTVVSVSVSPKTVHHGKSTVVTWELNKASTTTIQVARCQNSTCTSRTVVGKPIKRLGELGLNSMKLTLRVSPGRYAVLATARKSTKKAVVKVIK